MKLPSCGDCKFSYTLETNYGNVGVCKASKCLEGPRQAQVSTRIARRKSGRCGQSGKYFEPKQELLV